MLNIDILFSRNLKKTLSSHSETEKVIITYTLIDIQMPFFYLYSIVITLAMGSTALAVLLGCAVEDPKMATEFLPMLFVPQLLLSGK